MRTQKLDQLIQQLESHLECWKQFNRFINITRTKKFGQEDEQQFLEIKSVIVQELELILSSVDNGAPSREETHALISATPSLRAVSEMNEAALRSLDSKWHKIYIHWQSIIGQLKVSRRDLATKNPFSNLFGSKK